MAGDDEMTFKKFIRAFVAGMLVPAVFLPIAYTILFVLKLHNMHDNMLQFIPMYIPIIFGLTNVLYIHLNEGLSSRNANIRLYLTGGILGLFIAIIGIFALHLPTVIFGFTSSLKLMPLFILPVIYGAIFRFLIKWLNKAIAV